MKDRVKQIFLGHSLANPLVLPSGILAVGAEGLKRAVSAGFGLVTSKSLTSEPRDGHPGPVVAEYSAGLLNSMGLCNPGIDLGLREVDAFVAETGKPIIVSLFADNAADFACLCQKASQSRACFIELNLSCPNVSDEFGLPLAASQKKVAEITRQAVAASCLPVLVKLSPLAPDLPGIALAAQKAGAAGLTLVNTFGPGLLIDIEAAKPALSNCFGGVSGAGIFPLALRLVYECARVVSIPIIGVGGVSSWRDCAQMLMAGATLVGIGTALRLADADLPRQINGRLNAFLESRGLTGWDRLPKIEGVKKTIHVE